MTFGSDLQSDQMRAVQPKWGWFVALGVLMILLGFVAWMDIVAVTFASTLVIGAMLLIGGVFQLIHAFMAKQWRDVLLAVLLGILYVIGGLLIIREPVRGAIALTLAISIIVIVGGVARIVLAFRHRHVRSWGLLLLSGIVSLFVGALIYATLPWSGLWVLGTLIAVELIIQGVGWLFFGLSVRPSSPTTTMQSPSSNPPSVSGRA